MKVFCAILFIIVASAETPQAQQTDSFDKLAADFWSWRARYAPFTGDDVNRIERPGGVRDWSRAKLDNQRKELNEFEARWRKIDSRAWPIARQVDYRLVGSALSRVRWELDINPGWRRDPTFYIGQTLTPIVEALTVPGPYNEAQSREILTRINNVPPFSSRQDKIWRSRPRHLREWPFNRLKTSGHICTKWPAHWQNRQL